jgi:ribosomal protein S18 acetylase RimI-like enzyme
MKLRKKYSNSYISVNEFHDLCEQQRVSMYEDGTDYFLIKKEEGFEHLYYYCDSWDWLDEMEIIKKEHPVLVLNIVQRKGENKEEHLLKKGYSVYKIFQRMRRTGECLSNRDNKIEYCTDEDKRTLREMMDDTFDVLVDCIPSDDELYYFIKNGNIICVREGNCVAGFIIFEDKGKTTYIRMVCIDKTFQRKGIGQYLLDTYFQMHREYVSFTLWHDVNNQAAHGLYLKNGYKEENMYDYIFLI